MGTLLGIFSFVPSFVWKGAAILAIIGAVFGYGYVKGGNSARVACEAAAQRAQKAADAQDLKAEREGREQDLKITDELLKQKKNDDVTIEHLQVQLAKRPLSAPCYYPDVGPTGRVSNDKLPRKRTGN